jgi:hypothetical protein
VPAEEAYNKQGINKKAFQNSQKNIRNGHVTNQPAFIAMRIEYYALSRLQRHCESMLPLSFTPLCLPCR